MQIWLDLLSSFTVSDAQSQDLRTAEQLYYFETTHEIILPSEYKDFCKLFGSGVFGHYLIIYCPEIEQIEVDYLKDELRDSKDVEGSEFSFMLRDRETLVNVNLIQEILDSAFIFGRTSGGELLLWDLRTHSQSDDSYDIYMTRVEDFPGIYKVGRSFLEFIETFALGTRSYAHLPEWTHPSLQELDGTFTPINVPY